MNQKVIIVSVGIGILLIINAFGNGFNSAYAKRDTVRVDCKDLAIALITWDEMLGFTDDSQRTDIEDDLGDDGISNGLFKDYIHNHLDDLQDDVNDDCPHLKNAIKDYLDDNKFEIP